MAAPMAVSLEMRAHERFVGREAELAVLVGCFDAASPRVLHLSGVAGSGKSRLLREAAFRLRGSGALVIQVDCRGVEPSEPGLCGALASAAGAASQEIDSLTARISSLNDRVVLMFDAYELFWLMDTFIRRELCPRLGENVRVILASRNGPVGAWLASPESPGNFRALTLGPLTRRDAISLLTAAGFDEASAVLVNNIARGHPLALAVAAATGIGQRGRNLEDVAVGAVVDHLTQEYLATINDDFVVRALDAASVVRRATQPLLAAMLPAMSPADTFERLRDLPFVEMRSDGLFIHDAVRDAVELRLQAASPNLHRQYRIAAWRQLQRDVRQATSATLWRYTADILYLLQNPAIREGFFPSGFQPLAVEAALPQDFPAIQSIAARHEGPESCAAIDAWWEHQPSAFQVCRDSDGSTIGFFVASRGDELSPAICEEDPVAYAWRRSVGDAAPSSILLRRLLDREMGEAASGSRAAFGLDVKRTYMEMRPHLRYVYLSGVTAAEFEWCDALGFVTLDDYAVEMDGRRYETYRLDMGPGSVDAWLAALVARELEIPDAAQPIIDVETREAVLDSGRVPLTRLEFGVLRVLHERGGRPVSYADLMETVWGYGAETSSNVVEAVIRTLRKKLGAQRSALETVRGVGYRLRC
ncbi:MAG: winged helix-turn-helix domain-containing protein [Dehalococcoidia bacterium]